MADLQGTLRAWEARLGERAELGIAASLFDSGGYLKAESSYNADRLFPMASIVKIPIAMAFASAVAKGSIAFEDRVRIVSSSATPGPIKNPLDRLYFCPFEVGRDETLLRLIGFMLRDSDNTAADSILQQVGGVTCVQEFLARSRIQGICVTRSIRELLAYYYDLPDFQTDRRGAGVVRRTREILETIRRMRSAFSCRLQKEDHLRNSGEDCCTPKTMEDLLTKLVTDVQYQPLLAEMRQCTTGRERIIKGFRDHAAQVKAVAHKTGTLGSITNDAGIIRFRSGDIGILAVMINKSSTPLSVRERTIASVAAAIATHWMGFFSDSKTCKEVGGPS